MDIYPAIITTERSADTPKILGEAAANEKFQKININDFEDVLVGNCYERDLKRFSKIYDGSFKDFLELFDFEALTELSPSNLPDTK